MGSINKLISRYEISAVYTHPEAKVDIVLVHGLNGAPQKTWTAKNDVFWPADLLPNSLADQKANILVYGYNADVYSSRNDRSASDNFIHQHAQTLVTLITHFRKSEGTMKNSIIWVAHSLGGILTKRALLYSNDVRATDHEDYRSIYVSTYAIIFLGTPHTGAGLATWAHVLQAMSDVMIPRKLFQSESILLKTLKKDNETLQNINSHFLDICSRFKLHMAHENHKTDIKGTKVIVVDANSASPQLPGVTYYGIEATHSEMCKFDSVTAPGFRTVSTAIRQWVAESPVVIQDRWRVEEDERLARAKQDNLERMRPFMSAPTTGQPRATDLVGRAPRNAESDIVSGQTEGEVNHFMKGLEGNAHPLLDTRPTAGVQYDDENKQWRAQRGVVVTKTDELDYDELYQECFDIRDGFMSSINKYLRDHGQLPIYPTAKDNWNDVENSVIEACRAMVRMGNDAEDVDVFSRGLKEAFDDPDNNIEVASFIASFTPENFKFCLVLCAGLKTIFSAMVRAGYHRNVVYTALNQFPSILNGPEGYLDNLGTDKEFHRMVAALYASTLRLLRSILKWFVANPTGANGDATNSTMLEKVSERFAALKIRAKKLHRYAAKVEHLKMKELEALQKQNLIISSLSLRAHDDLRQDLGETLQRVRALEGLKEILLDNGKQANRALLPQAQVTPPADSKSLAKELVEAKELPQTASQPTTPGPRPTTPSPRPTTPSPRPATPSPGPTTPSPGPTAKQVLAALEFDPSVVRSDCEALLQMRMGIALLSDSRFLYIIRSVHLRAWLEIDESAALLINGGGESRADSESSYIAARLVESLLIATQTTPGIAAVAYFCGQHRHLPTDAYASPCEMAMSLLLQLVHARQDSLAPENLLACLAGLDPRRMGSICDALERLVDVLGGETILFVLLDGISFFAHPAARQRETAELLRRLVAIRHKSTKSTIKLLFTSPSRAIFVEELVDDYEVVNVPRTPPNSGTWNDSAFSELFGDLKEDTDDSSDG